MLKLNGLCCFFPPKKFMKITFSTKLKASLACDHGYCLQMRFVNFKLRTTSKSHSCYSAVCHPQMAPPPKYNSLYFLFNSLTTHLSVGYAQYYSGKMGGIIQATNNAALPFLSFSSLRVFLHLVCEVYATICIHFHLLFRDSYCC